MCILPIVYAKMYFDTNQKIQATTVVNVLQGPPIPPGLGVFNGSKIKKS